MSHPFSTGCLPLTAPRRAALEQAAENAVSMPDYLWERQGDMPVIKWDANFNRWLDRRIALAERYASYNFCLFPWEIFRAIPPKSRRGNIFAWDQGPLPSCSMHSAAHAYQCALLTSIALGAPLFYESFNPIYPFYGARGGNLSGGLDLWTAADWVNRQGLLPVSVVGEDNRHIRTEHLGRMEEGAKWQGAIVLIEDHFAEKIFRACRALCPVSFGSGKFYTRSRIDENGIKVMDGITSGGHAQCFAGWRKIGSTEYIFNLNSHGDIYGVSDEGEPASGAWITQKHLRHYTRDMEIYGYPYLIFGEGEFRRASALTNEFSPPKYPAGFRRDTNI